MKRLRLTFTPLAVLLAFAIPASAHAATQVGASPPPGVATYADCNANTSHTTRANTIVNPYVATVSGVITEWQFNADATENPGTLVMQTLSGSAMMSTFSVIAESAQQSPVAGQLNRFATRVPITAGEFVGLRTVTASHGCYAVPTSPLGEFTDLGTAAPAPVPGSGPTMFGFGSANAATNVSATIEPDADNDGFGDETQDGCPGNAGRNDDCVKPVVTIDKGPKKQTKKKKAKFEFSSDEAGATFDCSLDGKKFAACTSPFTAKKLKRSKHAFSVRAVDANNNTSAEADYKWKVKKKKKK